MDRKKFGENLVRNPSAWKTLEMKCRKIENLIDKLNSILHVAGTTAARSNYGCRSIFVVITRINVLRITYLRLLATWILTTALLGARDSDARRQTDLRVAHRFLDVVCVRDFLTVVALDNILFACWRWSTVTVLARALIRFHTICWCKLSMIFACEHYRIDVARSMRMK